MADRIGSLDPGELVETLSTMKDQLVEVVRETSERLEIERRMNENPWLVLGIAAGAGFVLGGGLWTAMRPLVKAAGRAAMSPSNLLAVAAAIGAMRATSSGDEAEHPEVAPTSH